MALIDDVKDSPGVGIFIGIGAVLLAPVLLPILASAARPLAPQISSAAVGLTTSPKKGATPW
ncbi:hypothetical protein [Geomesophilobacter sediminis]|uniref:Uncharacterized protein n=1 Tax=Geomesophilobacter sediminis TaxID=2798584 RepID=A0A8J7LUR3_9BACT|nr:hypothetical protein [Geomesophilobacter sediminis]MBJ6724015.1 hypothetical protein [Geomesophilobacter sediminis]